MPNLTTKEISELQMMCGAIQDISENSKEVSTKIQLLEVVSKIEKVISKK